MLASYVILFTYNNIPLRTVVGKTASKTTKTPPAAVCGIFKNFGRGIPCMLLGYHGIAPYGHSTVVLKSLHTGHVRHYTSEISDTSYFLFHVDSKIALTLTAIGFKLDEPTSHNYLP